MSWIENRPRYQRLARTIDPSIRLYQKSGSLWRIYSYLFFYTKESRRAFLEDTATAFGPLHFYPPAWSDIEKDLYHEGRHTQQARRFGLGLGPWVGLIPMAVAATLLLPVGITIRFWLELDAEAYALRRKYETGSNAAYIRNEMVEFAVTLSGPDYLWAWPRSWAIREANEMADWITR